MPENLQKLIQNNPCAVCRALGLPVCKGHGGKRGGGEEKKAAATSFSDAPILMNIMSKSAQIELILQESDLWEELKHEDSTFEYQNIHSLFRITLDLDNCKLSFTQKEDLSPQEKNKAGDFLIALKKEFEGFKIELKTQGINISQMRLIEREGQLEMSRFSPDHFKLFITKLYQLNMLPMAIVRVNQPNSSCIVDRFEAIPKLTVPNPFDISGPKPKG